MLPQIIPPAEVIRLRAKAQRELRQRADPARAARVPLTHCPDPVDWINEYFRIPETQDRRIPLTDYQQATLRAALATDADGNFRYSSIVWSDIKKSAKSTIAAAVALWRAFQVEWGQVVLVANDLKQADSRVGYYLRRAIELNPELRSRAKVVNYLVTLDNHTRIEAVPIDPTGEAGGGAEMVVFSELWGAHQTAQQRMWTEMTLSPLKYGKSFRWVETYAGFSGESPLLEQLYESGVKYGSQPEWAMQFNPPLECYTNESARLFCLWNTLPRNPWQTPEYYAQEESSLAPNEFLRVHRNQFVSSSSIFVHPAWWEACQEKPPELDKNQPVILAADAAVSGDSFGLLMLSGRGNDDIFDARLAMAWTPAPGATMQEGGLDYAPIEKEIRRLCVEYNVIELALDPYQLYDMGNRLNNELVTHVYFFSQGQERLVADKALLDRIRERRMRSHNLTLLNEHILNANMKTTGENDKVRMVKRSLNLKIDLGVCLSMAASRAQVWNL